MFGWKTKERNHPTREYSAYMPHVPSLQKRWPSSCSLFGRPHCIVDYLLLTGLVREKNTVPSWKFTIISEQVNRLMLGHGHASSVSSHSPRPRVAWQASDGRRRWGANGHGARLGRRHPDSMDEIVGGHGTQLGDTVWHGGMAEQRPDVDDGGHGVDRRELARQCGRVSGEEEE